MLPADAALLRPSARTARAAGLRVPLQAPEPRRRAACVQLLAAPRCCRSRCLAVEKFVVCDLRNEVGI